MKERFEGDNRTNLIDALKRQEFVGGDAAIAEEMAAKGELVEFQKLDKLIVQDAEDTEIYLLLAGSVSIVIKGIEYRSRNAGQHVGEMAAIEPTLKRSATVVANENSRRPQTYQRHFHGDRKHISANLASYGT